jgi:SAM-dependent methyltransferase
MKVIDDVMGYWDDPEMVGRYDTQAGHGLRTPEERTAWLDSLAEFLPAPPADVVDVGTGTGFLALLAAELEHRVVGFDLALNMLEQARAKAAAAGLSIDFRAGDAGDPPIGAASVDAIVNRHVLWTLPDPTLAVANWVRALRPGGRLVIIDAPWFAGATPPSGDDSGTSWDHHYRPEVVAALPLMAAVDASPVVTLLRDAGLRDVRLDTLPRIEAIERALGDPDDPHGEPPRYVVTGVR